MFLLWLISHGALNSVYPCINGRHFGSELMFSSSGNAEQWDGKGL